MSLFDKLKDTKFKSLKFGNDSFGGDDSLEPFIQKPIRDNNPLGVQSNLRDVATENRSRISKLLDTSRGVKFITTQKGLQLSNTRLEATGANKKTRITPLMFYTKENTLAQIGENPETGTHFDRFGLTPFMDDNLKYSSIVAKNNTAGNSSLNRLDTLRRTLQVGTVKQTTVDNFKTNFRNTLGSIASGLNSITGFANTIGGIFGLGSNPFLNNLNNKVNQVTKISSPYLSPIIDQYLGGPNTVNGVGYTTIRRFDYTNDLDKTNKILSLGNDSLTLRRNLLTDKTLRVTNLFNSSGGDGYLGFKYINAPSVNNSSYNITPTTSGGKDFKDIIDRNKKTTSAVQSYYGGSKITATTTTFNFIKAVRPVESINFNRNADAFKYFGDKGKFNNYDRNDSEIMSILFKLINPFDGLTLHRIIFSAYISDFKMNTDSTWNDISYIGRSENLYVYSKFKRTASFNFQIPCFNPIELREKHRALGALESSLAGKYSDQNKLGGIITYLYLGSYIKGEPGIINSISYSIPNDSSWDIDEKLAHYINVSVNFTLIHNQLPTFEKEGGFFKTSIKKGSNGFINSKKAYKSTGDDDTPPSTAKITPKDTDIKLDTNLQSNLTAAVNLFLNIQK
jgi:hypothetical protein